MSRDRATAKGKNQKNTLNPVRRLATILVAAVIICLLITIYLMVLIKKGMGLPPLYRTLLYLMIAWVMAVTAYSLHTFWGVYKEQQALKESEATYKTVLGGILDSIGVGVAVVSQDMEVLSLNKALERRHPHIDVFKRPNCYAVFNTPPRDSPCPDCPVAETLRDGQPHEAMRETGEGLAHRILRLVTSPIRDEDGRLVGVAEVVEDITERKKAEAALRESEEKLRSLYHAMSEGVCLYEIIADPWGAAVDYRILDVNPAYEAITGAKRDAVVGKKGSDFYKGGKIPHLDTYARVAQTGEPDQFQTYWEPGKKHFNISVFSPAKGRFATLMSDITARGVAEEALRDSEVKYRSLVDQSLQGIAILQGVPPRLVFVNPALAEMTGYNMEELLTLPPENIGDLIHPEDRQMFMQRYQDRLEGKPAPQKFEFCALRKDGAVRWLEMVAARIEYDDKPAVQAAFADITELMEAEQFIERERNLLRTLIDNMPDYIFVKDKDSRFLTTNAAHIATLGAKRVEDVVGKTDFDFFPRELAQQYFNDEQEVMRSGKPLLNRTEPVKDASGNVNLWVLTSKVPLRDVAGNVIGLVGISRDITAQKKAEDAQKA